MQVKIAAKILLSPLNGSTLASHKLRFGTILLPLLVTFLLGCSSSHPTRGTSGGAEARARSPFPLWRHYITITPEQIKAALSAEDCRLAEDDPAGHWGVLWEGLQCSIRLQKELFTNGEPVVACVTLRNTGDKVQFFNVGPYPEERDTTIVLVRGQERVLGVDDPKPRESFLAAVSHLRSGSAPGPVPISPGTQRQFYRDLSKMFDLSPPGKYFAHAERAVVAAERTATVDSRRGTNLLSGTVTFQIFDSRDRH